jgi:hypothetical protein
MCRGQYAGRACMHQGAHTLRLLVQQPSGDHRISKPVQMYACGNHVWRTPCTCLADRLWSVLCMDDNQPDMHTLCMMLHCMLYRPVEPCMHRQCSRQAWSASPTSLWLPIPNRPSHNLFHKLTV